MSVIELAKILSHLPENKIKELETITQRIVEKIGFVNSNLEEKQYFFTDIKREGKVLYNSGNFELSNSKELTPTRRREIAEEDFKNWYEQALDFLDDYKIKYQKVNSKSIHYRKCSFFLQQAVEMCYTTIEMVFTHYNPYEHNLIVLRSRTLKFDQRVKNALPYHTNEQQELFDYLNLAYIGARYHSEEDFPVTQEQLDYWGTEAEKLLHLTEMICNERIDCLKEIENNN